MSDDYQSIVVYWDYENCGVDDPKKATLCLLEVLRKTFPSIPITIEAFYAKTHKLSEEQKQGLRESEVKITEIPAGGKNACDYVIMCQMFLFALRTPPPAMIISGDKDFTKTIQTLTNMGYTTVLAAPGRGAGKPLQQASQYCFNWKSLYQADDSTILKLSKKKSSSTSELTELTPIRGLSLKLGKKNKNSLTSIVSSTAGDASSLAPEISPDQTPIGVIWDTDSCPFPKDQHRHGVGQITELVQKKFQEVEGTMLKFEVYGNGNLFPEKAMTSGWPKYIRTSKNPRNKHNSLENYIVASMFKFAAEYRPPAVIIVLSVNEELAKPIRILAKHGYKMMVQTPIDDQNASENVYQWLNWEEIQGDEEMAGLKTTEKIRLGKTPKGAAQEKIKTWTRMLKGAARVVETEGLICSRYVEAGSYARIFYLLADSKQKDSFYLNMFR